MFGDGRKSLEATGEKPKDRTGAWGACAMRACAGILNGGFGYCSIAVRLENGS